MSNRNRNKPAETPAAAGAETPAAAAAPTAETPAAQTDANQDGHDDTTGQFVDGNAGRPAEQHPAPTVSETAPAADDTDEDETAAAPAADGEIPVVVSVLKIDGHPAGRIFKPTDADQLADLTRLGAIRPATEDELAIYAPTAPAAEASDFE